MVTAHTSSNNFHDNFLALRMPTAICRCVLYGWDVTESVESPKMSYSTYCNLACALKRYVQHEIKFLENHKATFGAKHCKSFAYAKLHDSELLSEASTDTWPGPGIYVPGSHHPKIDFLLVA